MYTIITINGFSTVCIYTQLTQLVEKGFHLFHIEINEADEERFKPIDQFWEYVAKGGY